MAKIIDGKTYNRITGLCDLLIQLNNDLAGREDVHVYWDMNCDGIFSMCVGKVVDGVTDLSENMTLWFFFMDPDERYTEMIDKVNEWNERYVLQPADH